MQLRHPWPWNAHDRWINVILVPLSWGIASTHSGTFWSQEPDYFYIYKSPQSPVSSLGKLLADYDFVLIYTPGKRNPADGPSHLLIIQTFPSNRISDPSVCPSLLPTSSFSSSLLDQCACFLTLIGVHANIVSNHCSRSSASYDTRCCSLPTSANPTSSNWSYKDGLLLYKGSHLRSEILHQKCYLEHHDVPLCWPLWYQPEPSVGNSELLVPGINTFVKDYVNSCFLYQQAKALHHLRHEELALLPVPTTPWKGLTCDFIMELSVSCGKDFVLMFIDRITKMSHFIPCSKTTNASEFAKLFVSHIVRLYGLPDTIVSDCGSIFTSHFWSMLSSILQIDTHKSMAFHPQTDG
jgi:hypothetical protein